MWCISSYACVLCGLNGQGGAISFCMICFRLVANLVYEKIDAGNVGYKEEWMNTSYSKLL